MTTITTIDPEIIRSNMEHAYDVLKSRESLDNAMAAERGLKSYKLISVNFTRGDIYDMNLNTYYITIDVEGQIRYIVAKYLSNEISRGSIHSARDHYTRYDDDNVDFVFDGYGFSTVASLIACEFSPDGAVFCRKDESND